jgi:hypothetical protein
MSRQRRDTHIKDRQVLKRVVSSSIVADVSSMSRRGWKGAYPRSNGRVGAQATRKTARQSSAGTCGVYDAGPDDFMVLGS